jgi:mono/diheme cytochrome c family protein
VRVSSTLLVGACLGLVPACRAENTLHRLDFSWNRMQIQPRYDAYRSSEFFADRSAMRMPPEGTRAYAASPALDDAIADGTVAGRDVPTIPLPVTHELLQRGQAEFQIICAACHGLAGDGDSVPARFMARRPPSLAEASVRELPDGQLYKILRDGHGLMPGYASHLNVEERWAVVAYVRALDRSRHAVVARLPKDIASALRRSAP